MKHMLTHDGLDDEVVVEIWHRDADNCVYHKQRVPIEHVGFVSGNVVINTRQIENAPKERI
jgi:hypothetical protein